MYICERATTAVYEVNKRRRCGDGGAQVKALVFVWHTLRPLCLYTPPPTPYKQKQTLYLTSERSSVFSLVHIDLRVHVRKGEPQRERYRTTRYFSGNIDTFIGSGDSA